MAHCFASAPAKEASIGRTFDLVGPVAFTWREMIFKVLRALGKKGLYEQIPLLLLIRAVLWLSIVVVPCLLIADAAMGQIDAPLAEVATGLWIVLLLVALRWRRVIIFSIPGEPLVLGSELLNGFAPRELRPSEMLKMAVEDNAGDVGPTAETFAYQPETFEQGLAKIYR